MINYFLLTKRDFIRGLVALSVHLTFWLEAVPIGKGFDNSWSDVQFQVTIWPQPSCVIFCIRFFSFSPDS